MLCNSDGTPGVRLVYIHPRFPTKREFTITSPGARELGKKKAELAGLEARQAEHELDFETLQALTPALALDEHILGSPIVS
jgi:hypothetical protein